jgi:hypothetical protein
MKRAAQQERPKDLTIEVMVRDSEYLGDSSISDAQMSILKAIYGLRMSRQESEAFLDMTEGRRPLKEGYREATICVGCGSGKTDKILANVMLYEILVYEPEKWLAPGEWAWVPIVAQDRFGAQQCRDYIQGKAELLEEHGWEMFDHGSAQERAVTGTEIRFAKRVKVATFPCKKAAVRSKGCIAAAMDELGWWRSEDGAYNQDVEVQRAIRSRFRRYPARLIKISSPGMEEGVLYDDYQARGVSPRRLFVHAPTWVLWPGIPQETLDKARDDDPEGFARDFGAEFGKIKGGLVYLPAALVDGCTVTNRPAELPPQSGVHYAGMIDAAFKHDLFVAGVAHADGAGDRPKVVIDAIQVWRAAKGHPLEPEDVTREASELFLGYGVDQADADQFCDIPLINEFGKNGIVLTIEPQTEKTNHEFWKNLKAAMRRGLVELPKTCLVNGVPDDGIIKKDLTSLIANKKATGKLISVGAPRRGGCHDDISKVIAGLCLKLAPQSGGVDLDALNSGAISDRAALYQRRGLPVPESEDALPNNIMGQMY